jgi:hypothetical protein
MRHHAIHPGRRELMKGAKSRLLEVLAAIQDGEKIAPFFAADGVVELPFLHSVGIEPR